jgi:pimeloyl-ACP methyl ester carboxylesterase
LENSSQKFQPRIHDQDGLLVQKHEINTMDFYIVSLYRVLGRLDTGVRHPDKPPLLLMHGILGSSECWTVLGEKSLPHLLQNAGYDVWMGNSRGNVCSRKHMFYNSMNDSQYWEFSWHEMGIYDLPAMIDHILNVTGHEKLFYVGYSQGATQFYALASYLPEYNDKIIAMHGLAAGGFQSHARSPVIALLAKHLDEFEVRIGQIF